MMFGPMEFVEQLVHGSIHMAARGGDLAKVRKLLDMDPKLLNARLRSMTPLHCAADGRQMDVLRYLLTHRANPNAVDSLHRSALHYCALRCWQEGALLLLAHGANPDIITNAPFSVSRRSLTRQGSTHEFVHGTAMDVAIALKSKEMTYLLRRYSAHRKDELVGSY